jgi:hypothetical protein
MADALIGHTGFVGGNLGRLRRFDSFFNSTNFRQMAGRSFREVVCAGVSALKWWANAHPAEDRAAIEALSGVLSTVTAERFILISTVDVYSPPREVDEGSDDNAEALAPYGRNRRAFEDFCRQRFSDCYVTRLPGLFGDGLKKNVLYDLLNDNRLEAINPRSSFQYYDLNHLWADIERQVSAGARTLNCATEPIVTELIRERFFPEARIGSGESPETHYDIWTRHAGLRGHTGHYLYLGGEILVGLERFITEYRAGRHAFR